MSPAEDRPAFSVCIPSVRGATIAAAVESVVRQTLTSWELIVVMQGDDDDLRAAVAACASSDDRVRSVWLPERGVSRARNLGAAEAKADTIVFLDDDCEADADWLQRIDDALASDDQIGFVAGALIAPPETGNRWRVSTCPTASPRDYTLRPDGHTGDLPPGSNFVTANLAVRNWAWQRVGPFDEALGPGAAFRAGEDLDLLLRSVRAGVAVRFLPSAKVLHTFGRRYGIGSVVRMSTSYGCGQGAVAAKMTHTSAPGAPSWNGARWRRDMWRQALIEPWRRLRPHRMPRMLPRLAAFERAYRRGMRDFSVDDRYLLQRTQP